MGDVLVWLSPQPVPQAIRRRWQWPDHESVGVRCDDGPPVGLARHHAGTVVCIGRGHGRRGRRRFVDPDRLADQLLEPLLDGDTSGLDRHLGPVAGALVADRGRSATVWRDRFGRHPLQIVRLDQGSAVTTCPREAARLSGCTPRWSMLAEFIHDSRTTTDADVFEDLCRIRPAEALRFVDFDLDDRHLWWDPDPVSVDRPTDRFNDVLLDLGRLYGPHPHTLALSSGLDSATLAAFVTTRHPTSQAATFAIPGAEADEQPGAAATAGHLEIPWRAFDISDHWPLSRLDDHRAPLAWGPPAHPDAAWKMPFYRHLDSHQPTTPVVYGNGADEVLWVPPPLWFDSRFHDLDAPALAEAARHVSPTRLIRPGLRTGFRAVGSRWLRSMLPDDDSDRPLWARPDHWIGTDPDRHSPPVCQSPRDRFFRLRRRRLQTWGWERIVRSLATERRRSRRPVWTPFLDAEFWELSLSLNPQHLVEGGRQKAVLRRVTSGLLPDDSVRRPDTGGFDTVVERGLADRASRRIVRLLARPRLADGWPAFQPARFLQAWEAYRSCDPDDHDGCRGSWPIWKTLAAELWFRRLESRQWTGATNTTTEVRP